MKPAISSVLVIGDSNTESGRITENLKRAFNGAGDSGTGFWTMNEDAGPVKPASFAIRCGPEWKPFDMHNGEDWRFFFVPRGLNGEYLLSTDDDLQAEGCETSNRGQDRLVRVPSGRMSVMKAVFGGEVVNIVTLTHDQALNLWKYEMNGQPYVAISNAMVMADGEKIRLEHTGHENLVNLSIIPAPHDGRPGVDKGIIRAEADHLIFRQYTIRLPEFTHKLEVERKYQDRMLLHVPQEAFHRTRARQRDQDRSINE